MIPFVNLLCALEYIEQHLSQPISQREVAQASCYSLSHLHRMFAMVFHCSLGDYMLKRRLCKAAENLRKTNRSITSIAIEAQYTAIESFSRAFKKQYLLSPSAFRRQGDKLCDLFPKYTISENDQGGILVSTQYQYNVNQLSEQIMASKGTYILLVDIDHMDGINDQYGTDAGDIALATVASRIERSITTDMLFFRTGNDDFTIVTKSYDLALCESIAQSILSFAKEPIQCDKGTFTFSVSIGMGAVPASFEDSKAAIEIADQALMQAKSDGRDTYRIK